MLLREFYITEEDSVVESVRTIWSRSGGNKYASIVAQAEYVKVVLLLERQHVTNR